MTVEERFLKYVKIETTSNAESESYPSTPAQRPFLEMLRDELLEIGLSDASIDEYGYVMATIPATDNSVKETIGFLAHVDTSPDVSGCDVNPQIVENYDGGNIKLGDSGIILSPEEYPELKLYIGQRIITTDGTTLLGADDKAGVAEIITAAVYLMAHPELPHGAIRIGFTPDEEVGRGVDYFDVKRFGADWAYTVDSGRIGELEYENFNAAGAVVTIYGRNIHPGYAKGRMINAMEVAMQIAESLPMLEKPQYTEGVEGFFHLTSIAGDVERCTMHYIIRDHDKIHFEQRKRLFELTAKRFTLDDDNGLRIKVDIKDQYYNMGEILADKPEIVERASRAMLKAGVKPLIRPIRGGTDGARLSFMGLPCPNIFAGGENFHSRAEFVPVRSMEKAVETIVNIILTS